MKIEKFIHRSPIVPILLTSRYLESELKSGLRAPELTIWEALILVAIYFEDRACRPMELASLLSMSRSQVSQSVNRLIKKGLLARELSRSDARGIGLLLTSRGRKNALAAVEIFSSVNESIERNLSEESSEEMAGKLFELFFRKRKEKAAVRH